MFGKRMMQRGDTSGTALPPRLCLPPKPSRPLKTFVWGLNPPRAACRSPSMSKNPRSMVRAGLAADAGIQKAKK